VVVDTKEIMRVVAKQMQKREADEIKELPEGWMTASMLIKELRGSYAKINNFAEQYRNKYPEWFGKFRSGQKITEGFHPDLVVLIREKFEKKD
jgi:hypothetical protein